MLIVYAIVALIAGYFIGNIQFAVIFSRALHHDDVRRYGSGNAGSTNMLRVYGVKAGVLTFAGDLLKGIAGVLLGRLIAGENGGYLCAFGVVMGHCFPVLFGFKGGKGVASSLGAIFALNPVWGAIIGIVGLIVVALTRTISIASIIGVTIFMIISQFFGEGPIAQGFGTALFIIVVARHRENIQRLIKGEESKLGQKK